jgi:hypothetical protein
VLIQYGLGVDLGTTHTAAAVLIDGRVEVVHLGRARSEIPSLVFVTPDGDVLVGEAAERAGLVEPARLAVGLKRRMGDPVPILLGGAPFGVGALTARLLRYVVDKVAALQGGPPAAISVTHPASWGPYRRELLEETVALADVGPAQLLTEPVAAALQHAASRPFAPGEIVALYDLGGGGFDAAVLRRDDEGFAMLGEPEGIDRLGGVDFDEAVFAHVIAGLGSKIEGMDLGDPEVVIALARLRRDCVEAKEALSFDTEVTIPVTLPRLHANVRLDRSQLEALIAPSLESTVAVMDRALRSAGVSPLELSAVLLVGGSSRIPLVTQLLSTAFQRPVVADPHPEHSIAMGAALATGPVLPGPATRTPPGYAGSVTAGDSAWAAQESRHVGVLDHDVQFTVYRPGRLHAGTWHSILFYAHKSDPIMDPVRGTVDPLREVEDRATAHFHGDDVRASTVDARQPLVYGASLRIVPHLPGLRCDPTVAEIVWSEPVHEAHFRVLAPAELAGRIVRGWVRVWCGPFMIGELRVAMDVQSTVVHMKPRDLITEPIARYRKIFPSYSHRDEAIVAQFAMAARVIGDQYLQDVIMLRSGENWNSRLLRLIEEADVFQLFWSSNSMRSPHCRLEWENALALGRPMFVRPVYWEDPLPAAPDLDLPPAALRRLHFTRIPTGLRFGVEASIPPKSIPPTEDDATTRRASDYYPESLRSESRLRSLLGVAALAAIVALLILIVLHILGVY